MKKMWHKHCNHALNYPRVVIFSITLQYTPIAWPVLIVYHSQPTLLSHEDQLSQTLALQNTESTVTWISSNLALFEKVKF